MTTVPLAEARAQLSRLVDEAVTTHHRVDITRNGVRAAVLIGAEDYDELTETIDVLADAALVQDIRDAMAASAGDDVIDLDTMTHQMRATGRIVS
ncbi:type II toxin-antitoxin system Phd/YefM family antitoxin [Dermatophilaceae bacterium Soc4.6]